MGGTAQIAANPPNCARAGLRARETHHYVPRKGVETIACYKKAPLSLECCHTAARLEELLAL